VYYAHILYSHCSQYLYPSLRVRCCDVFFVKQNVYKQTRAYLLSWKKSWRFKQAAGSFPCNQTTFRTLFDDILFGTNVIVETILYMFRKVWRKCQGTILFGADSNKTRFEILFRIKYINDALCRQLCSTNKCVHEMRTLFWTCLHIVYACKYESKLPTHRKKYYNMYKFVNA